MRPGPLRQILWRPNLAPCISWGRIPPPPHPHPRLQPPAQLVLHVRVLWHVCRGPESGFWEPVVGRVQEAFPLVCVNTQCSVSNTHQCQEESWFLGSFLAPSTHICAIIIAASAKPAGVDW